MAKRMRIRLARKIKKNRTHYSLILHPGLQHYPEHDFSVMFGTAKIGD